MKTSRLMKTFQHRIENSKKGKVSTQNTFELNYDRLSNNRASSIEKQWYIIKSIKSFNRNGVIYITSQNITTFHLSMY